VQQHLQKTQKINDLEAEKSKISYELQNTKDIAGISEPPPPDTDEEEKKIFYFRKIREYLVKLKAN
jgi:hypothetical protein